MNNEIIDNHENGYANQFFNKYDNQLFKNILRVVL